MVKIPKIFNLRISSPWEYWSLDNYNVDIREISKNRSIELMGKKVSGQNAFMMRGEAMVFIM